MSIKRKIPLLVLGLFVAGGAVALYILKPPPEDPLQAAVKAYADSLDPDVRSVELHENIADIALEPHGQHLFVSFIQKNGKWVFGKNLVEDFRGFTTNPAQEQKILERFGTRIHQRFRMKIDIKKALPVSTYVEGDHLGVAGRYIISYSLPKVTEQPAVSGRYIETYRYKDGAWKVEGLGRIIEHLFQTPR